MFSSINNFQVLIKMQHLNLASKKLLKKKNQLHKVGHKLLIV